MAQDGKSGTTTIKRKPAMSRDNVSHGPAVVLHDTRKTQIVFKPFFIKHSAHTELAAKLTSYSKEPAADWDEEPTKAISLHEPAARKLLEALQTHLEVAKDNNDGRFLVIRVNEGNALVGDYQPAKVAAALTSVLAQPDIVSHLRNTELGEELTTALRGSIRLNEMVAAVAQLRALLDGGEVTESKYQDWCEQHSWAFGNAYVARDPVRTISAGDTLDLLLPSVLSGYRDIVELKRPDMDVLVYDQTHKNYYFGSEVSRAIGQCHRYMDVLSEVAANGLRDRPDVVAYHPRAIIVIGRSSTWENDRFRALHGLNRRLSGLVVMTYDQLITQGERLIQLMRPNQPVVALQPAASYNWEDEEFPTMTGGT